MKFYCRYRRKAAVIRSSIILSVHPVLHRSTFLSAPLRADQYFCFILYIYRFKFLYIPSAYYVACIIKFLTCKSFEIRDNYNENKSFYRNLILICLFCIPSDLFALCINTQHAKENKQFPNNKYYYLEIRKVYHFR